MAHAGNEMNDVSPDLFLDAVFAYQKTAAIKAAVGLDLFTAIAQEDGDLDRVAAQSKASRRGVRILCDCLTVYGFLQKDGTPISVDALIGGVPDEVVASLDGEHRRFHERA